MGRARLRRRGNISSVGQGGIPHHHILMQRLEQCSRSLSFVRARGSLLAEFAWDQLGRQEYSERLWEFKGIGLHARGIRLVWEVECEECPEVSGNAVRCEMNALLIRFHAQPLSRRFVISSRCISETRLSRNITKKPSFEHHSVMIDGVIRIQFLSISASNCIHLDGSS